MIKKKIIHYILVVFSVYALKPDDSQSAISYLHAVINSPGSNADDVTHARLQLAIYCTQKSDYWASVPAEAIVSCYSAVITDSSIPADIRLVCKYRYLMICSRSATPLLCDKKTIVTLCEELLAESLGIAMRSSIAITYAEALLGGHIDSFILTENQLQAAHSHVIHLYKQCDSSFKEKFIETQIKLIQIYFWGNKKVRDPEKGRALCYQIINEYADEFPRAAFIAQTFLDDVKQGRKEPTSWEDLVQKVKKYGK